MQRKFFFFLENHYYISCYPEQNINCVLCVTFNLGIELFTLSEIWASQFLSKMKDLMVSPSEVILAAGIKFWLEVVKTLDIRTLEDCHHITSELRSHLNKLSWICVKSNLESHFKTMIKSFIVLINIKIHEIFIYHL